LINGVEIAAEIKEEIREEIILVVKKQTEHAKANQTSIEKPGLAVIVVGDRKDSKSYVDMKVTACADLGINSYKTHISEEEATEELVIQAIQNYNKDENVHGIMVQLPLPAHLNEERILEHICITKDVDGLHPSSFGKIAMKGRKVVEGVNFTPCTPLGVIELIRRAAEKLERDLTGSDALVIGTSNVVGIPTALLILNQLHATVQVVNIKSHDIPEKIALADILVVCCGCAEMVQPEWIKPGAIVIDVGINPVPDDSERGFRVVGDVKFDDELKKRASACTPVPGGVGPMTIAMLMRNTLQSFKAKHSYLFNE